MSNKETVFALATEEVVAKHGNDRRCGVDLVGFEVQAYGADRILAMMAESPSRALMFAGLWSNNKQESK